MQKKIDFLKLIYSKLGIMANQKKNMNMTKEESSKWNEKVIVKGNCSKEIVSQTFTINTDFQHMYDTFKRDSTWYTWCKVLKGNRLYEDPVLHEKAHQHIANLMLKKELEFIVMGREGLVVSFDNFVVKNRKTKNIIEIDGYTMAMHLMIEKYTDPKRWAMGLPTDHFKACILLIQTDEETQNIAIENFIETAKTFIKKEEPQIPKTNAKTRKQEKKKEKRQEKLKQRAQNEFIPFPVPDISCYLPQDPPLI